VIENKGYRKSKGQSSRIDNPETLATFGNTRPRANRNKAKIYDGSSSPVVISCLYL
jgi:hypothetical protein